MVGVNEIYDFARGVFRPKLLHEALDADHVFICGGQVLDILELRVLPQVVVISVLRPDEHYLSGLEEGNLGLIFQRDEIISCRGRFNILALRVSRLSILLVSHLNCLLRLLAYVPHF